MRADAARWFATRTFCARSWTAADLLAAKTGPISVVLPALDEEPTIGPIVAEIRRELIEAVPLVDELVVVDSGSVDGTVRAAAAAGARVEHAAEILPHLGSVPGKGEVLWKSLHVTAGDLVVFIDSDLEEFSASYVTGLLGPLLSSPAVCFVKATYDRPLRADGTMLPGGGRVTELVARPLLNLHWPELAGVVQPLSGEYAGRRSALEQVPFVSGYGVELALLVDLLDLVGLDGLAQVDLGRRLHRHQSEAALGRMASAIWQTALGRLHRQGRLVLTDPGHPTLVQFERRAGDVVPVPVPVPVTERPPMHSVPAYLGARAGGRVFGSTGGRAPTAAVVSFRLGGSDGVSVEADKWIDALGRLGCAVRTVAGEGKADHLVAGLELDPDGPLDVAALTDALAEADLVIVENVCSLPRNPAATADLVRLLRGRPVVLHHHDLPWQRREFAGVRGWPPTDPGWLHVTINDRTRRELADRGIAAHCVYNSFPGDTPAGRRDHTRRLLDVDPAERLLLQPTRALPRKNVPAGIRLAEQLGAIYWLTGPAEDGYGPTLHRLLRTARCAVRRRLPDGLDMADAYAAADAVVFPSTWEGFGNPVIEAALHRRPLAVGSYPVLAEIARYGFRWFSVDEPAPLLAFLDRPDPDLLDHNAAVAARHFGASELLVRLGTLFGEMGWAFWADHAEPGRSTRATGG
jgi:glycosyltransferase involved in cell wall biosynthesis